MSSRKGKARAQSPDERTLLLPEPSHSHSHAVPPIEQPPARHARVRSVFFIVSIVVTSLLLSVLLFIILLAASFKPSPSELSDLPQTAFKFTPPSSISIVNITDDGILVNVSLSCGIDADRALGVQEFYQESERQKAAERGDRGVGAAWWESLRRKSANWLIGSLHQKQMSLDISKGVYVFPQDSSSPPLGHIDLLGPLSIPLVTGVPALRPDHPDLSWLKPISFTTFVKPMASSGEIWDFIRQGWLHGGLTVVVGAEDVQTSLEDGEERWWGRWVSMKEKDLSLQMELPIPRLPGLPRPGRPLDLSRLVSLQNYSLSNADDKDLVINAMATMPNFVRHLDFFQNANFTVPFGLPFAILLPSSQGDVTMAKVILQPVNVGQEKMIELRMSGTVTADLDRATDGNDTSALSTFLQNYLHGRASPIIVRGLSHYPNSSFLPVAPPLWLLSTLPSLSLDLSFLGPSPPPQIIRTVTIERMTIVEKDGKMKASGIIVAEVEMPKDMRDVDVDVRAVRPDVLVYDGPPPLDNVHDHRADREQDEYPVKAFGHIHPAEWLPSATTRSPDPSTPHRFIVRAPLSNVDLDILPGRENIMSEFVSKVIFKGGAVAGVQGLSDVQVQVKGVKGEMEVEDLPVRGEFWVGKKKAL
ncbi:hypothetical protein I305_00856 [Cryptococcus gattii E566]|nr:hypothetical protein I305_00856 [Cryptococcus gattii E566]